MLLFQCSDFLAGETVRVRMLPAEGGKENQALPLPPFGGCRPNGG